MKIDSIQDKLMDKYFLSPQELALYLNISLKTIYRSIEKRKIPFYRIGRNIRFKKEDIEKYVDSVLVESIDEKYECI